MLRPAARTESEHSVANLQTTISTGQKHLISLTCRYGEGQGMRGPVILQCLLVRTGNNALLQKIRKNRHGFPFGVGAIANFVAERKPNVNRSKKRV